MATSKLRQVLTIFETANAPLSLPQIARDLNVSQARLDGMIQHWVRKGKIKETGAHTDCGSCGHGDDCAFVMEMPRTFELAAASNSIPLDMMNISCEHHSSKR